MTREELREAVARAIATAPSCAGHGRAPGGSALAYAALYVGCNACYASCADAAIRVVVEACALVAEHHVCCTGATNADGAIKAADDIADAIRALATVKT